MSLLVGSGLSNGGPGWYPLIFFAFLLAREALSYDRGHNARWVLNQFLAKREENWFGCLALGMACDMLSAKNKKAKKRLLVIGFAVPFLRSFKRINTL